LGTSSWATGLMTSPPVRVLSGGAMPDDPFVREKFTKERSAARRAIREYFKRYPNKQFQTEVESWRHLQSQNFEFTMRRLREPVEGGG
jgi:hypothetical protein